MAAAGAAVAARDGLRAAAAAAVGAAALVAAGGVVAEATEAGDGRPAAAGLNFFALSLFSYPAGFFNAAKISNWPRTTEKIFTPRERTAAGSKYSRRRIWTGYQ